LDCSLSFDRFHQIGVFFPLLKDLPLFSFHPFKFLFQLVDTLAKLPVLVLEVVDTITPLARGP
jgi:hypothetical protein